MSTHNKEAAERELFERAYADEFPNSVALRYPFKRDDFGGYELNATHVAWHLWRKARALTASEAPATEQAPPLPVPSWARDMHGETEVVTLDEVRERDAMWMAKIAALSTPPAVPPGWKLVPVEPTPEMFVRGGEEKRDVAIARIQKSPGFYDIEDLPGVANWLPDGEHLLYLRPSMDAEAWAELHRLRLEAKGPDGYATWKDAAVAERVRRVKASQQAPATAAQERIRSALDAMRNLGVSLNDYDSQALETICEFVDDALAHKGAQGDTA